LKRKLEVQEEVAASRPAQPVIGAGPDGFFLRSPDAKYQLRFRGYTQLDSRWFSGSEDVTTVQDSFYFRRVRPIFEGTLAGSVDFRLLPDFANSSLVLQDAYTNLRFAPELQLQLGKFKSPVGLERLASGSAMWFIERSLPTLLVPNRDLRVILQGNARENLVQYQLAFLNGNGDNTTTDSDVGDDKDVVARVFAHPFQETTLEPLRGWASASPRPTADPRARPARSAPPPARRSSSSRLARRSRASARAGRRRRTGSTGRSRCSPSTS
jgi:phosphate-selective porin OprO/OprP